MQAIMNNTPGTGALKSILYVADDLHMHTMAKLVLEVIGKFEVRDCGTGREALLVAMDFAPDLILLNVNIPELDGLATLAMLRRMPHLADTPAMFVTKLAAKDDIVKYVQAGAIGVIPKPLLPMRLAGQLHDAWTQHAMPAH